MQKRTMQFQEFILQFIVNKPAQTYFGTTIVLTRFGWKKSCFI